MVKMVIGGLAKTVLCLHFFLCVMDCYQVTSDSRTNKHLVKSTYNSRPSRYHKLSRVNTRLDSMNLDDDTNRQNYKLRHKGYFSYYRKTTTTTTTTTQDPLFDDYGDWDSDDDLGNGGGKYQDDLEDVDEDDDDEDYYEDAPWEDTDDTRSTSTTFAPPSSASKPVSSLTEYKWQHYGTKDRVEQSRRQQLNLRPSKEQMKVNAAMEHYVRVNQQSKCEKPLPRVVSVQKEHPNPTKIYSPQCTILHRCAEDSGCCNRDAKCQYKKRVLVSLYFYTRSLGSSQARVEKLDFYNHTECECKEKSESASDERELPFYLRTSTQSSAETSDNEQSCRCPSRFKASRSVEQQECSCDCTEDNDDCIQLKKGKEHFSMTDRICIQDDECSPPSCEYGNYMVNEGKCPSKKDRMTEYRTVRINY